MIVTIEERYVYRCNHSQTMRINWRVNGSVLVIETFPQNVDNSIISFHDGTKVYTLTFGGLFEHNETTIQCVASNDNGSDPDVTPIVLFLIQGKLHTAIILIIILVCVPFIGTLNSVRDLVKSNNTLSWEAPFSLNLINADPDIVYCVEVYNITCGRSLLISECDVIETSYTNDALHSGYIYEYTVTPRSNVEGASNGTSLTVHVSGTCVLLLNSNVTIHSIMCHV